MAEISLEFIEKFLYTIAAYSEVQGDVPGGLSRRPAHGTAVTVRGEADPENEPACLR